MQNYIEWNFPREVLLDNGKRARNALEKIKERVGENNEENNQFNNFISNAYNKQCPSI